MSNEKITIRRLSFGFWQVWVPPRGPEAYEVPSDPDSALLGPYGDSYWSSWQDAVRFVRRVLEDVS